MPRKRTLSSKTVQSSRIIGHATGQQKGPTIFFFGGMHGNEKAGVFALEKVFETLITMDIELKGHVFGIRGNIPALLEDKRFLESDLNRLWTKDNIAKIKSKYATERTIEEKELLEIHQLVFKLVDQNPPPFYFIDFHTTSSRTLPFITINDALINRNFAKLFPLPVVLGIEEFLEGPFLSYMNEKGYVSLGFESGQHTEPSAIDNAVSFTWLTMVFAGALKKSNVPDQTIHIEQLKNAAQQNNTFYEVEDRYALSTTDDFKMRLGFESFQPIKKGTFLGVCNETEISAEKDAILFMPLYQKQGGEGFFLIRKIPNWALRLSEWLRKMKAGRLLAFMPGIQWTDSRKVRLRVNLETARFLAKPLFHLLGYRNRNIDKTHMIVQNRELKAKNEMYRNEPWF